MSVQSPESLQTLLREWFSAEAEAVSTWSTWTPPPSERMSGMGSFADFLAHCAQSPSASPWAGAEASAVKASIAVRRALESMDALKDTLRVEQVRAKDAPARSYARYAIRLLQHCRTQEEDLIDIACRTVREGQEAAPATLVEQARKCLELTNDTQQELINRWVPEPVPDHRANQYIINSSSSEATRHDGIDEIDRVVEQSRQALEYLHAPNVHQGSYTLLNQRLYQQFRALDLGELLRSRIRVNTPHSLPWSRPMVVDEVESVSPYRMRGSYSPHRVLRVLPAKDRDTLATDIEYEMAISFALASASSETISREHWSPHPGSLVDCTAGVFSFKSSQNESNPKRLLLMSLLRLSAARLIGHHTGTLDEQEFDVRFSSKANMTPYLLSVILDMTPVRSFRRMLDAFYVCHCLRDVFDEDWYRNPRSGEALRSAWAQGNQQKAWEFCRALVHNLSSDNSDLPGYMIEWCRE